MKEQIDKVLAEGFKPIIYIEKNLTRFDGVNKEVSKIIKHAKLNLVPIINETNITYLHKLKRVYVFRYGFIPLVSEAIIKRKGGIIVSGNLIVN